jgi:hypothetical protein
MNSRLGIFAIRANCSSVATAFPSRLYSIAFLLIMRFAEPEQKLWERLSSIVPQRHLSGFTPRHNHMNHREADRGQADELNRITASMADENIYVSSETNAFDAILARRMCS